MACWGRLAADVWDGLFEAAVVKNGFHGNNAILLDAQIQHWTNAVLPSIPLLPRDQQPNVKQQRQSIVTDTRLALLRLFIFRQAMLSLKYDAEQGRVCGDLALEVVQRISAHTNKTESLSSFRFHMTTALGSAMLILSTLIFRDLAPIGLHDRKNDYLNGFIQALHVIEQFSQHTSVARRILSDFKDIVAFFKQIWNTISKEEREGTEWFPQFLVPPNLKDLLPYQSLDFAQQHAGSGLSMDTHPAQDSDGWEFDVHGREGTCGVLWV